MDFSEVNSFFAIHPLRVYGDFLFSVGIANEKVTHSSKKGKRNNLQIRNLNSNDLDKNGNLKQSFLERRLVVSVDTKNGEQGIDVSKLNKQLNDLQFTEQEKQSILDELSNLSTAREKYDKFITLAKKKVEKKNDT